MSEKQRCENRRRPGLGRTLILMAAVGCIAALCGCSTIKKQTKKVVGALPFAGERLRKKVVIVPFENTTFIPGEEIRQRFSAPFAERLAGECGGVVWIKPGDPGYPEMIDPLPRLSSGRIDALALAKIGRASGISAFLLGNIAHIDAEEKEKGILMFRDIHYYESAQIGFQLYDTGTGTKLLDESLKESLEVDGAEFDAIIAKDLRAMYELNEIMDRIAAQGAEQICETLQKHPWQGYVIAVQDGGIVLSSGREIGLSTGDVLSVYRIGDIVEGKFGQRFIVPGTQAGEIEVTAVGDGRAEARPVGETDVAAGYSVRLQ